VGVSINYQVELSSEAEQLAFGGRLAAALMPGVTVFLRGDLGVGKTTLCRGIVNGMGFKGNVKSPTYTLVEPYEVAGQMLYHFDLYRLGEPSELEYMGCRDYFDEVSICLIEWPERGDGVLPEADLEVEIQVRGRGRRLLCQARSEQGLAVLARLNKG
jgi:tRNA threonylcarbamoyladenosine biosynthesis protein TsaE